MFPVVTLLKAVQIPGAGDIIGQSDVFGQAMEVCFVSAEQPITSAVILSHSIP
jgi:hypothetical protein